MTHIDIQGREDFPHWVPFSLFTQQALNRCLGVTGISHLAGRIQERLAYYSWVTTRVTGFIPGLRFQIVFFDL
ncbi:hypothetical protein M1A77_002294 [Salmonella enterica]|nr:hypothetical protein [Salmonella enterica subsp. enterica serovar Newport]EEN2682316.1 hypothetical protein [Salmonella enterica]EJC9266761.1 hypothetical protein [Salmonella enterica]